MPEADQSQLTTAVAPDARWKDLYRLGAIACIFLAAAIPLAILAYFIWPYTPGIRSVAEIFTNLQKDRLAGLMSLDLSVILLEPLAILQTLALYAALKKVNESYALIALVLGLMGILLWLTARPLVEMSYLSDQYATATTDEARNHYLAAGEALHTLFNGSAWLLSQFLIAISGTISDLLMLKTKFFSRWTASLGLALAIPGFAFWIPTIGMYLSLFGTLFGTVWFILLARDFIRIGWARPTAMN
jgi:Domain of unknown function (DUF4386)